MPEKGHDRLHKHLEEIGEETKMSAKVKGLGHIGFYVQDLDLMKDFYENFMGMTLTKVGPIIR